MDDPAHRPTLSVEAFLEAQRRAPVFDVRTPSEYAQAHIPGAVNLPLFSDDERAEIGTLYKRQGPDKARLRGLELVGPRMRGLAERALAAAPSGRALVHCWRGGMRSAAMAWLLGFAGLETSTLAGGYKAFRRHCLDLLERPPRLRILSGATGSGKTHVLRALERLGEPVVDLEGLAHHKGSVFGGLGEPEQPSQEHFENLLALALAGCRPDRPAWVEDESRLVGRRVIPNTLWQRMQQAPTYVLHLPEADRIEQLVASYGAFPASELEACVRRIGKRLGGLRTRQALEALHRSDRREACRVLLSYYDRAYARALDERPPASVVDVETASGTPDAVARLLLERARAHERRAPAAWDHVT